MGTFANMRGIVHAGSNGQSIGFPDVCKTPSPGGPIPIPYPNIGMSSDTSGGPSTVTIEGKMPMTKGAKYSKSSGDEAGSVGGVASSMIQGECEFLMYSFDVKVEGNNICRMGDPLFHNKKNIPTGVEMGEPVDTPAPPAQETTPPKATLSGTLTCAAGPLKNWPFILRKDGAPIDSGGLGGGSSSNKFEKGSWFSDDNGQFKFEQMPEGAYSVEVLLASGQLQLGMAKAPDPANESGLRESTPTPIDRFAFTEDPEN